VKLLRVCLLLLLVALLPVESMAGWPEPCHQDSQQELSAHANCAERARTGKTAQLRRAATKALGHCNHCAGCCAGMAMAMNIDWPVQAAVPAVAEFPSLRTTVAAFVSDVPERPPRVI